MAGLSEVVFDKLAFTGVAESALGTSYLLVKRGTNVDDVVVTTANTEYPIGITREVQATAGGAVRCQPLIPGQRLKGVSDSSIDAADVLLTPAANGKIKKATPAAGEIIVGRSVEAQTTDGAAVRFVPLSPFRYAAT